MCETCETGCEGRMCYQLDTDVSPVRGVSTFSSYMYAWTDRSCELVSL